MPRASIGSAVSGPATSSPCPREWRRRGTSRRRSRRCGSWPPIDPAQLTPARHAFEEAIATIERTVLGAERVLATVGGTWEDSRQKYNKGYQMLTLMSDGVSLSLMAVDMMKKFSADFR